jgi:hypothetical protein
LSRNKPNRTDPRDFEIAFLIAEWQRRGLGEATFLVARHHAARRRQAGKT